MENTTQLITTGMYKNIRHPIYSSLIPGVLGVLLKDVGSLQVLLVVVIFVSMVFTAKIEEREMLKKFGSEYEEYIKKTKMFIPFIY